MKKKYIVSVLFLFIVGVAYSQSIPRGMNYQAVARDKSGEPMADKIITLKIDLQNGELNQPAIYYSEIHRVVTNKFGLFTLVIGKGSTLSGDFNEIPWSTENIWLSVGIKMETEIDFTNISSTKLLAVPYAFHAGTASQLSGNYTPYVIPGSNNTGGNSVFAPSPIPASSWQVAGNSGSNPPTEFVGTADAKDLVFKTSAIERMRIYSTGNINMNNSLTIGVDLTVGRDANINRDIFGHRHGVIDSNFTVKNNVKFNLLGGSTTNYGPFTVANVSPTILTGSLRVDQITNLQNGLNVNNATPTLLTGALRVNGTTNLYESFKVNSKAPSVMTGTLRVDSNVIFKQHLTLDNSAFGSSHWSNGEVVVAGGLGIGQNLNVGDSAAFGGPVEFAGQVKITDGRSSYSPDSGALVVFGSVGIKSQLNVRYSTHLYDSLKVGGPVFFQGFAQSRSGFPTLQVSGITTLQSRVTISGNCFCPPKISDLLSPTVTPLQSDYDSYPLQVQGSDQGIAVVIEGSKSNANNFVSFLDDNGRQGRIEGFAAGEYYSTDQYKKDSLSKILNLTKLSLLDAIGLIKIAGAVAEGIGAATSTTGCVGLGACVTTPIISLIIGAVIKVTALTLQEVALSVQLGYAAADWVNFSNDAATKTGVTYESGAGDYAEYLEMLNIKETMIPGDIVGIRGGKITRNTDGADKIMVISNKPIVLGNTPVKGKENNFKKVAFLGQVPVRVIGNVNAGDYILPDGNYDGLAFAVHPSEIKSKDIKNIAGIAWESATGNTGIHTVNVSVGLNVNDNNRDVQELEIGIGELRNKIAARNLQLKKLVPGFMASNDIPEKSNDNNPLAQAQVNYGHQTNFIIPKADNIIYHQVTREEVTLAFEYVEKEMLQRGEKLENNPVVKRYKSDPGYKEILISQIQAKINNAIDQSKELDVKLDRQ